MGPLDGQPGNVKPPAAAAEALNSEAARSRVHTPQVTSETRHWSHVNDAALRQRGAILHTTIKKHGRQKPGATLWSRWSSQSEVMTSETES